MSVERRIKAIEPLINQGWSFQQIADRVGMSRSAVAGFCWRNGLQSLNDPGWSEAACAARWADPQSRERHSQAMRRHYEAMK